ncbi:hypothetical protein BGS_1341 [Beggiatoa sp. SS]|nr:hypothetical protein BGS_1341 [Beggiatoa sp. SS]
MNNNAHPLVPPHGEKSASTYTSCCAPCSGEIMATLIEIRFEYPLFFYNPNIQPLTKYEIRKKENNISPQK